MYQRGLQQAMRKFWTVCTSAVILSILASPARSVSTQTYETHRGFYRQDTFGRWHATNPNKKRSKESSASNTTNNKKRHPIYESDCSDPDVIVTTPFPGTAISFDPVAWRKSKNHRAKLLHVFLLSNRLVGMDRPKVHELLGEPEPCAPPRDVVAKDAEWYRLRDLHRSCVISDPHSLTTLFLELSYSNNQVNRFRIAISKFGHSQADGRNPFEKPSSVLP
jgi:hypothetical protein